MKLACILPPFIASTMVGKSVNRCDSNRVVVLVRDAKSVTGHVRCQVTGKKPTVKRGRAGSASSAATAGRCQHADKRQDADDPPRATDRNIDRSCYNSLDRRQRLHRSQAHLREDAMDGADTSGASGARLGERAPKTQRTRGRSVKTTMRSAIWAASSCRASPGRRCAAAPGAGGRSWRAAAGR